MQTDSSTSTYHRKCGHMFFGTQCRIKISTCRALLSSSSFFQVDQLHRRLLDWAHVADGDCWKDKLLCLMHVNADADWEAEVGPCQTVDAVRQTTHHHQQRHRPVARLHNALATHASCSLAKQAYEPSHYMYALGGKVK